VRDGIGGERARVRESVEVVRGHGQGEGEWQQRCRW
jgi:hypothetical protein